MMGCRSTGYGRVVSTVIAFTICFTRIEWAAFFYLLGQGLDAVDGTVARKFDQCSKFGAVLDMLTDRMSTAVLLIVLGQLYDGYWGVFASLIVLDIVSHWYQMQCKSLQKKKSHKGSKNQILNFYYTGFSPKWPYVLLIACSGNEFFLVACYVLKFTSGPALAWAGGIELVKLIWWLNLPIFIFKQAMNIVQLYDAASEIALIDWREKHGYLPIKKQS